MQTNLSKLQELLGYTGGTLNQMSEEIGLSSSDILNLQVTPGDIDYTAKAEGRAAFTCSGKWLKDNKVNKYYGNITYWHYAIKNLRLKSFI